MVLFADSFENGFGAMGTIIDVGATLETVGTPVYHGNYAAHAKAPASAVRAYAYKTITGTPTLYAQASYNFPSIYDPYGLDNPIIMMFATSEWTAQCSLQFRQFTSGGSKIAVFNVADGLWYESATFPTALNTYYTVEMRLTVSPTAGVLQVWVNGQLMINVSGINTGTINPTRVSVGLVYPWYPEEVYVDNFVIDTSYIGTIVSPAVSVSPSAVSIQTNQAVPLFTASPSGGTPPYTINWYDRATGSLLGAGNTLQLQPFTTAGTYSIYAVVTDTSNMTANSADVTITVSEIGPIPLSITISPLSANLVVGQSVTFTASPTGGTPTYTITWRNGSGVIVGTGFTYTFVASAVGNNSVYATVTDLASGTATSATATISVSSNTVTLTVAAGTGGTVRPSGVVPLTIGQTYYFVATIATGYYLNYWDLSGTSKGSDNPLGLVATVDMDGKTLTVNFATVPPQPITVNIAVTGNGAIDIATGSHQFNIGDTITINAIPQGGQTFLQWMVGTQPYTTNPLILPVTIDLNGATITATFTGGGDNTWMLLLGGVALGTVSVVLLATTGGKKNRK